MGYGLETIPPLLMVRPEVSWQLAAMSCCAALVLSYATDHENVPLASCAVVFDVETVCGEAPDTPTEVLYRAVPPQLLPLWSENDTVPARLPPAVALMVAESFGTHVCAVVIDEGTELTTTVSFESRQSVLWVVPLLLGESPL
jgi:hypothetical protein